MTSEAQITLEKLMADMGRERYWAKVNTCNKYGHASRTPVARYLLRESVESVSKAVAAWRERAKGGKASRGGAWYMLLDGLTADVIALLAVKCVLDASTRPTGMAAAAFSVSSAFEEEQNFRKMRKVAPFAWRDLKKRMLRKGDRRKRGALMRKVAHDMTLPLEPWARGDKIALGTTMIELVAQNTSLVELKRVGQGSRRVKTVVAPTDATLSWLETSHEAHESLFPFYLPTVDLPVPWDSPFDGGYHTNLILRRPLVKTIDRKSLAMLVGAAGGMGEVYDAVNAIQDTAWEINPVVLEVAKHFWSSGIAIGGIPERVDEPPPVRPEGESGTPEHKAWRVESASRHQRVMAARSHRVLTAKVMFMAERFVGTSFYYPHMADFRGRLYPVPFFLQPQGSSIARGLLRFAVGGPVATPDAVRWFKVHGANSFGIDKVSFADRTKWVDDNEAKIRAVHRDPVDCRWWADADHPWEFLAWCLEYAEWLDDKGMESKVPIAMDGSNNGLQLFSLLMRDPVGAAATNCVPSDYPRDIYQEVADDVTASLLVSTDPMAAQWVSFVGGRIPREAVKRQVMTLPYGCSFHSCITFTRDWYEKVRKKNGGVTPFERGYGCSNFLAALIWASIGKTVGPARRCMDWLRDTARLLSKAGEAVRWTAPSGFPVRQEYTKYEAARIETAIGETVRRVRYRNDVDAISPADQVSGIAPNFVHSLDAALLVKSVNAARDAGVMSFAMVHDSYGVPACDAQAMFSALRDAAAEMFKDNLLERFRQEVVGYAPEGVVIPEVPEGGDLDPECVRKSPYFFA